MILFLLWVYDKKLDAENRIIKRRSRIISNSVIPAPPESAMTAIAEMTFRRISLGFEGGL